MERRLLPVYYGWAKLNKIAKREALTVIFLNDFTSPRTNKDGYDGVTRYIDVCAMRYQTDAEREDAKLCNRIYTVYSIFMDDKHIRGSLDAALHANFLADKNNVSEKDRKEIMEKLKTHYIATHRGYREPRGYQLSIEFED